MCQGNFDKNDLFYNIGPTFAGYSMKLISDHLRLGVKIGPPSYDNKRKQNKKTRLC